MLSSIVTLDNIYFLTGLNRVDFDHHFSLYAD